MAKFKVPALRYDRASLSRSKVLIGIFTSFVCTSASAVDELVVKTALMPGCACRYEVICGTACCGFELALGVDSISSVQAGPLAGAGLVAPVLPAPSPSARRLHRSSRFCPL